MKKLLIILVLLTLLQIAFAQTYVDISWDINGPQSYTNTDVIYNLGRADNDSMLLIKDELTFGPNTSIEITSNIRIFYEGVLSFSEGCSITWREWDCNSDVYWDPMVLFATNGAIIADGTPENPIVFSGDNNNNGILDYYEGMQIMIFDNEYLGSYDEINSIGCYFDNCVFEFGRGSDYDYSWDEENGGLISIQNSSKVAFLDCTFRYGLTHSTDDHNNKGGGLRVQSSKVILERCLFYNNQSDNSGGAAYFWAETDNTKPEIKNSLFIHNESGTYGGAVYITDDTNPIIENCFFAKNSGGYGGDAIYSVDPKEIRQCSFLNNGSPGGNPATHNITQTDCVGSDRPGTEYYNEYLQLYNPPNNAYGFYQNFEFNYLDWLPKAQSPAVNAVSSTLNDDDFLGKSRLHSYYSAHTIGPFEWTTGAEPEYPWLGNMLTYNFSGADRYFQGDIHLKDDNSVTVSSDLDFHMMSTDTKITVSDTGVLDTRNSNSIKFLPQSGVSSWNGLKFLDQQGSDMSYLYNATIQNVENIAGIEVENWDNLIIRSSKIKNCTGSYGGIITDNSDIQVLNSEIFSNNAQYGAGGIYAYESNIEIVGCIIRDNVNNHPYYPANVNLFGDNAASGKLINCTIMNGVTPHADNNNGGLAIFYDESKIYNTLFYNNGNDIWIPNSLANPSEFFFKNNLYLNRSGNWDGITEENNIIQGNPYFSLSNYTPYRTSPCLNAGFWGPPSIWLLNGEDYYGNTRKQYGRFDIGAVEFNDDVYVASFSCEEQNDLLVFSWNWYNNSAYYLPESFAIYQDGELMPDSIVEFDDFSSANSNVNYYSLSLNVLPVNSHDYKIRLNTGIESYPYFPNDESFSKQTSYTQIENFTASDNDYTNFPGYIGLEWDFDNVNSGYYTGFKIERDGNQVGILDYDSDLTHFVYHDTLSDLYPEVEYNYSVTGFIDTANEDGDTNTMSNLGEYLVPEVLNFSASDGSNDYPGVVRLSWEWHSTAPKISKFYIYKNDDVSTFDIVNSTGELTYSTDDTTPNPGEVNLYKIKPVYIYSGTNYDGQISEDPGFIRPNGIISGRVESTRGNPVPNVEVVLNPTFGSSLEFDAEDASKVVIADEDNTIYSVLNNYTIEFWLKKDDSVNDNSELFSKGNIKCLVSDSGIKFGNTTNFVEVQDTPIISNEWAHIAIVSKNDTIRIFQNLILIGEEYLDESSLSSTGALTIGDGFTGKLDDIRFWNFNRTPAQIERDKNRIIEYNSTGLTGYWRFDENVSITAYDETVFTNHGLISNAEWSNDHPEIVLSSFSRNNGEYTITGISYSSSGTSYQVTPQMDSHVFTPFARTITLSASNISANMINFTDNSMIQISGVIKYSYGNVESSLKVVDAEILVNGDTTAPPTYTNSDGEYQIELENGGDYTLTVDYRGMDFHPNYIPLENQTFSVAEQNFRCTTVKNLNLSVRGGIEMNIGEFDLVSANANGHDIHILDNNPTITTSDGDLLLLNVPPVAYQISIAPALNNPFLAQIDGDENFINNKSISFESYQDSLYEISLDFIWKAPIQLDFVWPESVISGSYVDYSDSLFKVIDSFVPYEVKVIAFEDYSYSSYPNQKLYLNEGEIDIVISDGTLIAEDLGISNGEVNFELKSKSCYLGGIEARKYQLAVIAHAELESGETATISNWVFVQGERARGKRYITTSPAMPVVVLHDPPGDNSFSYFSSTSTSKKMTQIQFEDETSSGHGGWASVGPETAYTIGFMGVGTEISIDIIAEYEGMRTETTVMEGEKTVLQEFSISETITTSDGDNPIGTNADVFVGYSQYYTYGLTDLLSYNPNDSMAVLDFSVKFVPGELANKYIYTRSYIDNTLLPSLQFSYENAGNDSLATVFSESILNWETISQSFNLPPSTQASDPMWGDILELIEDITFSAGLSYENVVTTSQDYTNFYDKTVYFDEEDSIELGLTVNDVGGSYKGEWTATFTETSENDFEDWVIPTDPDEWDDVGSYTETTYGYVLSDNDASGTVEDYSDNFLVRVYRDKYTNAPSFFTLAGESMAPWEKGTAPREGVEMMFPNNGGIAQNVQPDLPALFVTQLTNTSQTEEEQIYKLEVVQGTNPTGALVKVNGIPIEGAIDIQVPGLLTDNSVNVIVTVDRGPLSSSYNVEGLKLRFFAENDLFNSYYIWSETDTVWVEDNSHKFWDEKPLSVSWLAPYSRVNIRTPEPNFIYNSATGDTAYIRIDSYDTDLDIFQKIDLMYKKHSDPESLWYLAQTVTADTLSNYPAYYDIPLDLSSCSPDGEYNLKAVAFNAGYANYNSSVITGTVDVTAPILLSVPTPADELLEINDIITISFNELIDPGRIDLSGDVSLYDLTNQAASPVSVGLFENQITITLESENWMIENHYMKATVTNICDINGNLIRDEQDDSIAKTFEWEFFVNRNPISWNISKIDLIKPIGEALDLSVNLSNSGGQIHSYVITDDPTENATTNPVTHTPDWLSLSSGSGSLAALESLEIQIEISDQIGFGHYETTLYAITNRGKEPLVIEIDVLSNPPTWSLTEFTNFQSSMSIIGELNIQGTLSTDSNDILGAFIEDDLGNLSCCGIANIENMAAIPDHPNQVFLTIYSNIPQAPDSIRTVQDITFRIWDYSANKEFYGVNQMVFPNNQLHYQANSILGSPLHPIEFETMGMMVQEINCNPGWTWFSTNLELNPNSVNSVLSSLNPNIDDIIKDNFDYSFYYGDSTGWGGDLITMNNNSLYKIKLETPQTLEIVGELTNPDSTEIPYAAGWNWISYIPHLSKSVNQAMINRTNNSGDFIKNQNGYAFYVNEELGWIGSLIFMNPGEGYMMQADSTGSFTYPGEAMRSEQIDYPVREPVVLNNPPAWSLTPQDYEFTANVTAELSIDQVPAETGNYMIGAFVGEECRGVATPIEINNGWIYFITVYSNSYNEEIQFRVFAAETEEILETEAAFNFQNDLILGTPSSPFSINIEILGTLLPPQNVIIEVIAGEVTISWDEVSGANSYKIYGADSPEGIFTDVTSSGAFSRLVINRTADISPKSPTTLNNSSSRSANRDNPNTVSWISTDSGTRTKFYYVISSTE